MRRSIYTVGGTVQAGGGRYVERAVDDEFLTLCREHEFCYVLTARQMGKSSLMVRTAEKLTESGTRCAIVDLSQVGVLVTAEEWYLGILTAIEDSLDLDVDVYEWWANLRQLGLGQRLTRFFQDVVLPSVDGDVVVFFDEIDSTLSLDFTDDFFAAIRFIYNARSNVPRFRRLSIALIGVATPSDLISDPTRTPFNIGRRVDVEYFTAKEARPLADGFEAGDAQKGALLDWVLNWTSGHPFLTQRLCYSIAHSTKPVTSKKDVDQLVADTFLGERSEQDSNLRFVHDMLTSRAPDKISVLAIYRDVLSGRSVLDDRQSQSATHLKLSGIVSNRNGRLTIRNEIYARVFDNEWLRDQRPEHWIKRVPPAVIGLVAACFAALILLGLAFTQYQKRAEEERRREQLDLSNARLTEQVAVSDSLNVRLRIQAAIADSLRFQEALANAGLRTQARIADSLRQIEQSANLQLEVEIKESDSLRILEFETNQLLSEQFVITDSLKTVAEQRLETAREARLQTISVALAHAANRQTKLGNPDLGALLARQAFEFGSRGKQAFVDPVYDALRQSLNALSSNEALRLGGPAVIAEHSGGVRAIANSPSGAMIASAGDDGVIAIHSITGSVRYLDGHDGSARTLSFHPTDGVLASGGDDGTVRIWSELDRQSPQGRIAQKTDGAIWAAEFSPDGHVIAYGGEDGVLAVSDYRGDGRRTEIDIGPARVRDIAFSPDGSTLAVAGEDSKLRLWKWSDGQALLEAEIPNVRILAVEFAPDGHTIAAGDDGFSITLWSFDRSSDELVLRQRISGHEGPVYSLDFSPDGNRLASGSGDKSVPIWDLVSGAAPILLEDHDSWVWAVAFDASGSRVLSGSADRKVRAWNTFPDDLASKVCTSTGGKELSREEWDLFVGNDFAFETEYAPCVEVTAASASHE